MCVVLSNLKIKTDTPVSNETFLSHYGTKTDTPRSISDVPKGKIAVMNMDAYSNIHVAQDESELSHLRSYEGTWYLVDKSVVQEYLR